MVETPLAHRRCFATVPLATSRHGIGRGGALALPTARNSQRRAFTIGFAVKLTALLSALAGGYTIASPHASGAMPVFSVLSDPCAFWLPYASGCGASLIASLSSHLSPCRRSNRFAIGCGMFASLATLVPFGSLTSRRPSSTQDPRQSQCRKGALESARG